MKKKELPSESYQMGDIRWVAIKRIFLEISGRTTEISQKSFHCPLVLIYGIRFVKNGVHVQKHIESLFGHSSEFYSPLKDPLADMYDH